MIDCYRILLRNGPTGGNLEDVALKKTIVAGTDPVAIDAYVAKAYWNLDAEQACPICRWPPHAASAPRILRHST